MHETALLDQLTDEHFQECLTRMVVAFRNDDQFKANPTQFAHIRLAFRPLPAQISPGIWLYSEQAYTYDLWQPYRQGIHHVQRLKDRIRVENFAPADPLSLAGGSHEPSLLGSLSPADLRCREGCAMEFFPLVQGGYRGQLEAGCRCLVPRDGTLTYLVSEVLLDATTWRSRDRGFDPETHNLRWGLEDGQFQFERIESFASELPTPASSSPMAGASDGR